MRRRGCAPSRRLPPPPHRPPNRPAVSLPPQTPRLAPRMLHCLPRLAQVSLQALLRPPEDAGASEEEAAEAEAEAEAGKEEGSGAASESASPPALRAAGAPCANLSCSHAPLPPSLSLPCFGPRPLVTARGAPRRTTHHPHTPSPPTHPHSHTHPPTRSRCTYHHPSLPPTIIPPSLPPAIFTPSLPPLPGVQTASFTRHMGGGARASRPREVRTAPHTHCPCATHLDCDLRTQAASSSHCPLSILP